MEQNNVIVFVGALLSCIVIQSAATTESLSPALSYIIFRRISTERILNLGLLLCVYIHVYVQDSQGSSGIAC